jgi:hypothetical protein
MPGDLPPVDASALVRLLRDPKLQEAWYDAIDAEAVASCAEFLFSACGTAEYDDVAEMLADLHPDADYRTVARHALNIAEHNIHDTP